MTYFVIAATIYVMLTGQPPAKEELDNRNHFTTMEACKDYLGGAELREAAARLSVMVAAEHVHDDPVPQTSITLSCERRG
jgi:hypothetical protein